MKHSAQTYTDIVAYNRIPGVKEKIQEALRDEIRNRGIDVNWTSEQIFLTEEKSNSNRKCEDKLLVILSVDDGKF